MKIKNALSTNHKKYSLLRDLAFYNEKHLIGRMTQIFFRKFSFSPSRDATVTNIWILGAIKRKLKKMQSFYTELIITCYYLPNIFLVIDMNRMW